MQILCINLVKYHCNCCRSLVLPKTFVRPITYHIRLIFDRYNYYVIPHLSAISRVFRLWDSVSNTDHDGSRIFQRLADSLFGLEQMGPIWGSIPCQKIFCMNTLFPGEIIFSKGELVLWRLYGDRLSLIKKWTVESNNFLNNGTCGNTMVIPQTVR